MTRTRTLILFGLLFAMSLATLPAQAQTMWKQAFGYQMAELLQSEDPAIQETALQLIIEIGDRNDGDIVLWPAADRLVDVYETATVRAHRQMALAALSKVDNATAYTALLRGALNEKDAGLQLMLLQTVAASRSIGSPDVAIAFNQLLKQIDAPTIALSGT